LQASGSSRSYRGKEDLFYKDNYTKVLMIRYVVFNEHSSYNFLLRKPSLNKLRFVVSNIHLKVKYPINRKFGWCYKGRLRCDTTLLNGKLKNKRSNFVLQNKRIIIILDLDPRVSFKEICFQLVKSLKEVFLKKKRKKKGKHRISVRGGFGKMVDYHFKREH